MAELHGQKGSLQSRVTWAKGIDVWQRCVAGRPAGAARTLKCGSGAERNMWLGSNPPQQPGCPPHSGLSRRWWLSKGSSAADMAHARLFFEGLQSLSFFFQEDICFGHEPCGLRRASGQPLWQPSRPTSPAIRP